MKYVAFYLDLYLLPGVVDEEVEVGQHEGFVVCRP